MLSFWEEGAANILGSENSYRHYIIIVFLVIEELAEIHASYCLHFFNLDGSCTPKPAP